MADLLTVSGLEKSFLGVRVLRGVDFDLRRGEVHALLGENGAGKSTLTKIVCGAYPADAGTVAIDGVPIDLAAHTPRRAEDLGIATVYQNFHLVPHLSVGENLSLGRFVRGRGLIRWREVHARARQALARVGLDVDPRTPVNRLTVAQKQLVEIAAAISKNARILILDEPTAALGRREIDALFRVLAEVTGQGIGVVYISHRLDEVKQVSDRITVLRDGQRAATLETKDADLQHVIQLMIGKAVARDRIARERAGEVAAHPGAPGRPPLLEVRELVTARLPAPLSFAVPEGEILGVTGLVGAGKTELARALFGLDRHVAGGLLLAGVPVRVERPRDAVQLGIGYLSEDRDVDGLCLELPVAANVSLAQLAKERGVALRPDRERRAALELVSSLGLKIASTAQRVRYLSGGNKQKVVFGKWLTAGCRLLILDEPTMGIDVGARGDVYALVRRFVQAPGRAVIFVSSDVDEVLEIADRVLVMAGRALVGALEARSATKLEVMQLASRGTAAGGVA